MRLCQNVNQHIHDRNHMIWLCVRICWHINWLFLLFGTRWFHRYDTDVASIVWSLFLNQNLCIAHERFFVWLNFVHSIPQEMWMFLFFSFRWIQFFFPSTARLHSRESRLQWNFPLELERFTCHFDCTGETQNCC